MLAVVPYSLLGDKGPRTDAPIRYPGTGFPEKHLRGQTPSGCFRAKLRAATREGVGLFGWQTARGTWAPWYLSQVPLALLSPSSYHCTRYCMRDARQSQLRLGAGGPCRRNCGSSADVVRRRRPQTLAEAGQSEIRNVCPAAIPLKAMYTDIAAPGRDHGPGAPQDWPVGRTDRSS